MQRGLRIGIGLGLAGILIMQCISIGFATNQSIPIVGIVEKSNSGSDSSSGSGSGSGDSSSGSDDSSGGSGGSGGSWGKDTSKWQDKPTEPIKLHPKDDPYTGVGGLGYIEPESIGAVVNMKGFVVPNRSDIESLPNYIYNIGDSNITVRLNGSIDNTVPDQLLNNEVTVAIGEELEYKLELTNSILNSAEGFNAIYSIEKVN